MRHGMILPALLVIGCGTTRVSDTARTATEQLLISHSVDQAVSEMDLSALAGKKVFFDHQFLDGVTDKGYIISSIRQALLAQGCLLQEKRDAATYVVEARAGAVGTDRTDLMYGIPQVSVPAAIPGVPGTSIPEIPLAKRTNRQGVAKIAVFAYNRDTGQALWQSGVVLRTCTANDRWLFGAGPFPNGTLYTGTHAGEQQIQIPVYDNEDSSANVPVVSVTEPAVWPERPASAWSVKPTGRIFDPCILQTTGEDSSDDKGAR
jgi:hypothetical protein